MAESLTNAVGCDRSVSESWASTTAGPSNVPKSTQVVANVVFMSVPWFMGCSECLARCR
jgi:hypothetical protein